MSTVKHDKPISKHTTMIWCPRRCSPMILGMKEFSPECKYKVRITLSLDVLVIAENFICVWYTWLSGIDETNARRGRIQMG